MQGIDSAVGAACLTTWAHAHTIYTAHIPIKPSANRPFLILYFPPCAHSLAMDKYEVQELLGEGEFVREEKLRRITDGKVSAEMRSLTIC